MYIVNTNESDDLKTKRINVKVTPDLRRNFAIAAKLMGSTTSGLLSQYMTEIVDRQKERRPEAFLPPVVRSMSKRRATIDARQKKKTG
jgi:hypothetical protein